MYDMKTFHNHINGRDKSIYHKIVSDFSNLMRNLRRDHGPKLWLIVHEHVKTSLLKVVTLIKKHGHPEFLVMGENQDCAMGSG